MRISELRSGATRALTPPLKEEIKMRIWDFFRETEDLSIVQVIEKFMTQKLKNATAQKVALEFQIF